MSSRNDEQDKDPVDGYSLREYRDAVAKLIKLLIRARAKHEPGFLSEDEFKRWHLADISSDGKSIELLLQEAAAAYEYLWRTFIGPNGSGGVSLEDPRWKLKERVIEFAIETPPEYVLTDLRQGVAIDWTRVAKWETLDDIRTGLDALPERQHQTNGPVREVAGVAIGDPAAYEVLVGGRKVRLTQAGFNVVCALIDVFPNKLTKDQLVSKSGHSDAVNILKRIIKKHRDLAAVINLAGTTGGGYGICPATPT